MDDISNNSQAMPEAVSTPVEAVETPNPVHVEPKAEPAKPQAEPVAKPTAREALEAASAKVEAAEKTSAAREAKAAKDEKLIDPKAPVVDADKTAKPDATTKVEAKPTDNDAPTRFNADAKTAWATAPDAVKAETHRALRELEAGVTKYNDAADAYEPIRKFSDLAKEYGMTLHDALDNYVGIDQSLASKDQNEQASAIEKVLKVAGTTPAEYAAWVQGGGKAVQQQSDPMIGELRQQVEDLKNQLGQVSTSIQSQQEQDYAAQIETWKADKPLAETLADEIAYYVNDEGLSLDDAYQKAKNLFEDKARKAGFISAPQTPSREAPAHTRLPKSITGSPGTGSYPASAQPSLSIKDSIRRAAARVT